MNLFSRWTLTALLAGGLLTGCAAPVRPMTCADESQAFVTDVQLVFQKWQDASTLAGSTARMSLAPQIANLQSIRREVQALTPPSCAQPAQQALVKSMDGAIDGFMSFLSQEPQATVDRKFKEATLSMASFQTELQKLSLPADQ